MALCCIFVPSTVLLCRAIKEHRVLFFNIMIPTYRKNSTLKILSIIPPSSLSLFFIFCSSFCRIRSLFFTLSTSSCPYHSLFSLFLRYFLFFSDDDYESTEGVNVYKLSRTEYFWAMFNAGSISECWEILKDGKEISRAHNMFYCHLISYR